MQQLWCNMGCRRAVVAHMIKMAFMGAFYKDSNVRKASYYFIEQMANAMRERIYITVSVTVAPPR